MFGHTDYKDFINAVEGTVDMRNIKNRQDLQMRLEKFFYPKQPTREPTDAQLNVFSEHYGLEKPKEIVKRMRKRKITYVQGEKTVTTERYNPKTKQYIYKSTNIKTKTIEKKRIGYYDDVFYDFRGNELHRNRDIKTGRFIK